MAANAATPVLQMEGIFKRFGAVQALTDVHFDVTQGEVVAWSVTTVPASPP